jgi:hypothetical protein
MNHNIKNFLGLIFLVSALFLSGCISTHDAIPMSQDTYMIRVEDHGGIFAFNRGKMKGEALKRAQAFAESKRMVAIPLGMKEHPVGILGDWAAVEYQFRLVPPGSEAAQGAHLIPRADVVIETNETIRVEKKEEVTIENKPSSARDIYQELMKLDDLRQRGILTEEEFDQQKRRLLNQ